MANHVATYPVNNRRQHPPTNGQSLWTPEQKLDQLLQKKPQRPAQSRHNDDRHFYTRVINLTNINFNKEEMQLLKDGLNYSIESPATTYAANLIAETERAIRLLDVKMQNTYRIMGTRKLKQILSSTGQSNVLQKDNCMC